MKHRSRSTYVLAIFAFAGAGVAFAQEGGLESPTGAPALLLLVIGGAVAWLRSTPLFAKIDGPVTVPLFALVVGGTIGVGFELLGAWEPETTAALGRGWAGAAGGILAAIETVFGVSLGKYFAKIFRRTPDGKLEIETGEIVGIVGDLRETPAGSAVGSAVGFALDFAEKLLGQVPGGAALVALYPVVVKWAQSPAVLTDDVRAKIQADVLGALSRAGLVGQDLV